MATDDSTVDQPSKHDEYMLTTIDNPYNPFTHWDEWFAYDELAGYNTSGLLARIAVTSHELSETDQNIAISNAIDEIVRENYLGIYTKAYPLSEN